MTILTYQVYQNKIDLIRQSICPDDIVLDVGFWGQGVRIEEAHWPHKLLVETARHVDGVDLEFDVKIMSETNPKGRYLHASAEDFSLQQKYSVILAGDIIEHLPNAGLFLDRCREHLAVDGRVIITTPNAFGFFVLAGKLMHPEPPVNRDHTCYYTIPTLSKLLEKCGWEVQSQGYLFSLGVLHKESLKKKLLNILYRVTTFFTTKYLETIVLVVKVKK